MSIRSILTTSQTTEPLGFSFIADSELSNEIERVRAQLEMLEHDDTKSLVQNICKEHSMKKLCMEDLVTLLCALVDIPEERIRELSLGMVEENSLLGLYRTSITNEMNKQQLLVNELKFHTDLQEREFNTFFQESKECDKDLTEIQSALAQKKTHVDSLTREINQLNNKIRSGVGDKVNNKSKVVEKKAERTALTVEIDKLSKKQEPLEQKFSQLKLNFNLQNNSHPEILRSWGIRLLTAQEEIDSWQEKFQASLLRLTDAFLELENHLVSDRLIQERERLKTELEQLCKEAEDRKIII